MTTTGFGVPHLSDFEQEGIVGVLGDVHGDTGWAMSRVAEAGRVGVRVLLQVGDLGVWGGRSGAKFLRKLEAACQRHDVLLASVLGNHEDHARIGALVARSKRDDEGGCGPLPLSEHVVALPRGHRWSMGGRTFVALGGAPSVDYLYRTENVDWWPQECISADEADAVAAAGPADVMLTHDSPDQPFMSPPVAQIVMTNPMGWPKPALAYAARGRERLTRAFLGVRPTLLVHGHYHVAGEATVGYGGGAGSVQVVSLANNGQAGSLRVIDLATLSVGGVEAC